MPYTDWTEIRRNRIINPIPISTGWTGIYATLDFGAGWLRATVNTATSSRLLPRAQVTGGVAGATPVVAGEPYYLRAEVRHSRGMQMEVRPWFMASNGTYVSVPVPDVFTDGSTQDWKGIELSGVVPEGAAYMGYQYGVVSSTTNQSQIGDVFEVRHLTSDPGEYFDGNAPDSHLLRYTWLGAQNASASIMESRQFIYPSPNVGNREPLRPEDLLVEFRDRNLIRRGAIPAQDINLKMQPMYNGVGSWSITLPAEHRAVPFLRTPGAGIIVTNHATGKVEMSGSVAAPQKRATAADKVGMVTISGLDDNRLLWDAEAFPDPQHSADPANQTKSNDVRTGKAETIMREYVAYNIANGALMATPVQYALSGRLAGLRNLLKLEEKSSFEHLGTVVTKSPRFQVLGDLLRETALEGGGLGFRIVQIGSILEFQVYQPTDRRDFIRLDLHNGTLEEQEILTAPPDVTRVIVGGQGEGVERTIFQRTTAEALAAEDQWGFVIERFKDQRNTNDMAELEQSAEGELKAGGFTKVSTKASPSNNQTMVFMQDFFLGDHITVLIDGQETYSQITEAAIIADSSGIHTGVAIGSLEDFDPEAALKTSVEDNTRRLEHLETNAEGIPSRLGQRGQKVTDWNLAVETGFYWADPDAGNAPTPETYVGEVKWSQTSSASYRVTQELYVPYGIVGSGSLAPVLNKRWVRTGSGDSPTSLAWTEWVLIDTYAIAPGGRLGPFVAGGPGFDPNTALETGTWYLWAPFVNVPPEVNAGLWALRVTLVRARVVQYLERVGDSNEYTEVWRRTQNTQGVWSAWKLITRGPTSFTPSVFSGLTVGNGTLSGQYAVSDGWLSGGIRFLLGSTSAVTGDVRFNTPVTPAADLIYYGGGRTTNGAHDLVSLVASNTVYARAQRASGDYLVQAPLSSTVPGAWSAGQYIEVSFSYPI